MINLLASYFALILGIIIYHNSKEWQLASFQMRHMPVYDPFYQQSYGKIVEK